MIAYFLRRPLSAVIASIALMIAGIVALTSLPVSQFPTIVAPTVTVTANYSGADAETVETTTTTPLEHQLSGVPKLRSISSTSGSDGSSTITCTFDLGYSVDQAANDVQNAINLATSVLPTDVVRAGISVTRNSSTRVLTVAFYDTGGALKSEAITQYLENQVMPVIQRIPGVATVVVFGQRRYAMRIWLNPTKLSRYLLTPRDVVAALQAQNVQIATGAIGAPPTTGHQPYKYNVTSSERLKTASQFADIVLKVIPNGGGVRIRDVGRVELGAESYDDRLTFNGQIAVGLGITTYQDANAIDVSRASIATLNRISKTFPAGLAYHVSYDRSAFVVESIRDVAITLVFSVVVVIGVIFAFYRDVRSTLIPAVTIPVSLLGAFFAMKLAGASVNTLTLLGLTVATGIVVDDAIVVVDNAERRLSAAAATDDRSSVMLASMKEVSGPIVAASIAILAVFVPAGLMTGSVGVLYKQFAVAIGCAVIISLLTALTLTPVLTSLLGGRRRIARPRGGLAFLHAISRKLLDVFERALRLVLAHAGWSFAFFFAAVAATVWFVSTLPLGFIPNEDQGFFIVAVRTPDTYSFDQTQSVTRRVEAILRAEPGIVGISDDVGSGFDINGSNYANMYVLLAPWDERSASRITTKSVISRLRVRFAEIPNADVTAFGPSSIPGLGYKAGFAFELEDRGGHSLAALSDVARGVVATASATSKLSGVDSDFVTDTSSVQIKVKRQHALQSEVDLNELYDALKYYLTPYYVNDWNYEGGVYRVYVQADASYRAQTSVFSQLYVWSNRNTANQVQLPISSFLTTKISRSPSFIKHFNLSRSIEITGSGADGVSSGEALRTLARIGDELPAGYGYDWTGIAREENQSGGQAAWLWGLGFAAVLLILIVQFGSILLPLAIVLPVPLALLGAAASIYLRHGEVNLFAQIGFLVLIGISTKNAILVVEFANNLRRTGLEASEAVVRATMVRLRPILMTSVAFSLGIVPLALSSAPGSNARTSLGTVVFFGAACATILNLFATPVVYVVVTKSDSFFRRRFRRNQLAR